MLTFGRINFMLLKIVPRRNASFSHFPPSFQQVKARRSTIRGVFRSKQQFCRRKKPNIQKVDCHTFSHFGKDFLPQKRIFCLKSGRFSPENPVCQYVIFTKNNSGDFLRHLTERERFYGKPQPRFREAFDRQN